MASKPESPGRDPSLSGVTHVFFDFGGTLVSAEPGPTEIFRSALAKAGHLLDPGTVRRSLLSPDLIVTLIQPMVREREREFFRSVNARIIEHMGLDADDVALDDIHSMFERTVVYRAYPETLRTLKVLQAEGFSTGVVSNFSHRLPEILERLGLAPLLDSVTYSFNAGAEKPHPRIFRNALAQANARPERVLMVGDSYEADYLGARQAGLHAVLLCRQGAAPNPCPTIRSLDELPSRLGARRSRL